MPTPNLSLPYLEAGQAQKHVTHNEALRLLDAVVQLAVVAASASPPGAPADGERHIVAPGATGVFAGHENEVAAFQDGAWIFLMPAPGWRAWNAGDATLLVWDGAAWSEISGGAGGGDVSGPAGGTDAGLVPSYADTTGKLLARKANAYLFDGERAADGGNGNAQVQVSKEAAGDTASWFFATDHAPRGEIGFIEGDDELRFKVHDGSGWIEALSIVRATGQVLINGTPPRERLSANRTYYVRTDGADSNNGLSDTSGGAFATIQGALNETAKIDFNGFTVTIQIADGTYTSFSIPTMVGQSSAQNLVVNGNNSNPGNVVVSHSGSFAIAIGASGPGARATIQNLSVSAPNNGFGLSARSGGQIRYLGIAFGACGLTHLDAASNGLLSCGGSCTITGDAPRHFHATSGGSIVAQNQTVTASGSRAFSTAFAHVEVLGKMETSNMTFTGTFTGARYSVTGNGVIQTFGAGANYFPGSSGGTSTTGGQYI